MSRTVSGITKKYKGVAARVTTLKAEMKVLRAEWSDWGERHVRRSREGSGRAVREAAEIQWAKKLQAKAAARI